MTRTVLARYRLRFEFDRGEWVVFDGEAYARGIEDDVAFRSGSADAAHEAGRRLNGLPPDGPGRSRARQG